MLAKFCIIDNILPMRSQILKKANLPDSPGIYLFKDKKGNILYIGRATSLNDRVKSYFRDDLISTRGPLLVDMVSKSSVIEHIKTDSVLEAVILEANMIKEYQPYYNTKEKDNKSHSYIVITEEDFPKVLIVRGRNLVLTEQALLQFKIKEKFGPYPQASVLKQALNILRRIFPFRDEKSFIPYQESFYKSLKLSPDTSLPGAKDEYIKTIRNISLFLKGKKKELVKTLEKEMSEYADKQEFEKAERVKKTIYALSHIQDIALLKKENIENNNFFRIEAYDVAHMSGKDKVGVMAVVSRGEADKSEYRKFKISKDVNDDVLGLKEIILRRFSHDEWRNPDLIVVDGGLGQINAAKEVLSNLELNLPIVAVVKDNTHKADHFLGDEKIISEHKMSILKANAEAHRFAISYHKNLRSKTFLKSFLKKK